MNRLARFAMLFPALLASAQTPSPAPAYTGCVMTTEAGDYTFCEPNNCSALTGKLVTPKLSGHTVTLRGTVQAATAEQPRTVVVTSIVSIGAECDQNCSPRPPKHRGLGGHEHPGSEGGTPGVTAPIPPEIQSARLSVRP